MLLRKLKKEDIDKLIDVILDEFQDDIKTWEKDLEIKNKNITIANVEQVSYLARYDEIRVNLKSLLDYYDMRVKQVRSESLQMIHKSSDYSYSFAEKEKLVDSDPKYIRTYKIYLEVKELHNMVASIVEQFKNRAYALHNLVKIHAASLEDITL